MEEESMKGKEKQKEGQGGRRRYRSLEEKGRQVRMTETK
jgi:hypothetical protein